MKCTLFYKNFPFTHNVKNYLLLLFTNKQESYVYLMYIKEYKILYTLYNKIKFIMYKYLN